MKCLSSIPQSLQSLQGSKRSPSAQRMKKLHHLIGWPCNAKSQQITEGENNWVSLKIKTSLYPLSITLSKRDESPRRSQKKRSTIQETSKDSTRSVNQRLVAPVGYSGKKPGRKQDICYWRLSQAWEENGARRGIRPSITAPALQVGRSWCLGS